jgi:uncharacterized membrane protein
MIRCAYLVLLVGCMGTPLEIDEYPCPPAGTQLTYESFGKQFLGEHCNSCHNASESYRHGAPESYRFETLDDVRTHADRIFVRAAAANTTMPPGPDDPPSDERALLAEWLACGAP